MTREERSRRFQADDYIQHNPRALRMGELTGAKGRDAWVKAFDEAARRKAALFASTSAYSAGGELSATMPAPAW